MNFENQFFPGNLFIISSERILIMQITLPDNVNLQNQANAAGFVCVEDYVIDLLNRDAERVAIQKGLDDIKAGRLVSFEKVKESIRRQFDLPAK